LAAPAKDLPDIKGIKEAGSNFTLEPASFIFVRRGLAYFIAASAVLNSMRKPYTQPNRTHPIIVNLKRILLVAGA